MKSDPMKRVARFGAGVMLCAFGIAPLLAHASIMQTGRNTTYTVSFGSGFSNAVTNYSNSMLTSGTGYVPQTLSFFALPVPSTFTLSGHVVQYAGGPPPASVDLLSYGNWGFGYQSAASATPGVSFLTSGSSGGLNTLTFAASPSGFIDLGGTFNVSVVLPGNFSTYGTGSGDHAGTTLDPSFSIVQNFVYDATSNTTLVSATDPNYAGNAVDLGFTLYESPAGSVPEPSSFALFALGLLGLLLMVGKRNAGASRS